MPQPVSVAPSETERFWQEFAARHWEQRPLSLPAAPVQLDVEEEELLNALSQAADRGNRSAAGSGLPRVVVTVDGRTQPIDTRPFLPLPQDDYLDDYLARVDERMREHEWSVAVSGLHAVSAPLWDRAKRLSDDVYRCTGTRVAGRVDMDTFIGRYTSTNVGVHTDHAGNFGFTVRGRKTLLTWPPECAEQVPQHTADYASARGLADVLVGVPGALTYFPSRQLHVGESPDAVAVNVNIAFFTRNDPAALVVDAVGALLARTRADGADPGASNPHDIPPAAAAALRALASLPGPELEDVVWERHMRVVTSGGLGVGRPAESAAPVPRDARVRLHDDVVVRQRLLADGRRAVAAQGHTLKVADHPQVEAAVAALADGDTLDLAGWESRADTAAVPLLHAALLRLVGWRAVEVEAAVSATARTTERVL
ncbi:hypothetical protein N4P33_19585 [Streptomyces sp. 15-116A]|uniref:hypothetical protein n=1 Tax=Streptomyces sp. 15-116A TaxID=2259035 RepID=UPI0021B1CB11|nr:hypothetical protein [Streptomyces sp. 15-116A]MCT7354337.1 hypothetical protein [Streptomyces sp. 15-116A]